MRSSCSTAATGTGKTTIAEAMRAKYGYRVIHSSRTPDGTDIAGRYRRILDLPGPIVLDRAFISELVYGPLFHGRSRLTKAEIISLAMTVASRGGVLVHLTGLPDVIITRLSSRDGTAVPEVDTISTIVAAYREAFALLEGIAPVLVADTTNTS
jgi:thymidylate kinase